MRESKFWKGLSRHETPPPTKRQAKRKITASIGVFALEGSDPSDRIEWRANMGTRWRGEGQFFEAKT